MNPKEKAEELLQKFRGETDGIAAYNYDNVNKKCALMCVDELIKDNEKNESIVNGGLNKSYWQQVKTEIENLK